MYVCPSWIVILNVDTDQETNKKLKIKKKQLHNYEFKSRNHVSSLL